MTTALKRISGLGLILLCGLSAIVAGQTPQPGNSDSQTLVLNKPLERTIRGGETHSFTFDVKAGHYARVEVEQKNINVIVSLFAPDGKLVIEMDRLWREPVSAIARKDGLYGVEIKAHGNVELVGSYSIKLVETRLAVPEDGAWIKAEMHLSTGRKYYDQKKFAEALKEYEAGVKLWKELNETEWEGIAVMSLGLTFSHLSGKEQAIKSFLHALELFRRTKDRIGQSNATHQLGQEYEALSQYGNARDFYETALLIFGELKDKRSEAHIIDHLGNIYFNLGNYEKSLDYCGKALAKSRELGDLEVEARALSCIGDTYRELNQLEKTRNFYLQALSIARTTKNRLMEASLLTNLAFNSNASNQLKNEQEYFEEVLLIYRDSKDLRGEAFTLINAGQSYEQSNKNEKAQEYFEFALKISIEKRFRSLEIQALESLGSINTKLNQLKASQNYYEQALTIAKETTDREMEGDLFRRLMLLHEKQKKISLAIIYGKQALNIYQETRSNIKTLDKKTQASFLKQNEKAYRKLSDLLISQGRFIEAQAVLDLLKEEEYEQIITRRSGETPDTLPYSKAEADVIAKIENIASWGRKQAELQKEKEQQGDKFPAEKQLELDKIFTNIEIASKAFRESLNALGKIEKSVETQVAEIESEKNLQRSLGKLGKELQTGAVAIYTVIGTAEDKSERQHPTKSGQTPGDPLRSKFGWVILVTPEARKAYPIDVRNLEQTVFQFREALSSDRYDPQPLAEKLYTAIFRQTSTKQKRTLEGDLVEILGQHKNKTIMWSLDGVLRYLPMAALHDGKNYLVEKYRHVLFTKQSLLWLNEKDAGRWQALGLGVSEAREGFSPLPGAEKELSEIVKLRHGSTGIYDGAIRLNGDFKEDETVRTWRDGKYPVVHIASHYSFNPTDQTSSFLLVGDGKLTFAEMQDKDNLFGSVDLLTLSACDTAVSGNGKEAEGFAYLAQSLGAKSVIASLWKVSDAGTPELMIRFYKLKAENPLMSKGEAFRQAQLSLLGSESKAPKSSTVVSRSEKVGVGKKTELTLFVKDEKKPFAHPHYWSSFVLIGNWR